MRSPSKPSKILLAETTPIQLSGDDIRRSTGTKKMNERSPAPSTSPPSMNTFVKSLTPYDWCRDDFARWEKDRLSISSSSSSSKESHLWNRFRATRPRSTERRGSFFKRINTSLSFPGGRKVSYYILIFMERVFRVQRGKRLVAKAVTQSLDGGGQEQECKKPIVDHRSPLRGQTFAFF